MPPNPLLTLIFIAGNHRERVQRALRGVLSQDIADQIAIIVYDRADDPKRDLPELTSPNVINYEAVGKNTTLGELQKRGLLAATTDIVAFIEEHVLVPPGWARECLRLHAKGYAGVTGFFLSGNPQHRWSKLTFSITYGNYCLAKKVGETIHIPGDNSSFIRSKLLQFEDDLAELFDSDILLIRHLVAAGEKCYRADLALKHWNEDRWQEGWTALRYWSQMYMCNRLATEKWSLARRLLRIASIPLVPLVRGYKNFKQARANGMDMKRFFVDLPSLLFLHSGSAAGIGAGLLFGYQDCAYRFADCETNASRSD